MVRIAEWYLCVHIYSSQIALEKCCTSLVWSKDWTSDRKACPQITCAVFSIQARLRTDSTSSSSKYFSIVHCFHQKNYRTILYCFNLHLVKVLFCACFFSSTTDSVSQGLWKWKPTRIRSKIFHWNGGSVVSSLPSYQQAKYLHCAEKNKWNNEVKTHIQKWGHTAGITAYFCLHQWRGEHI